MYHIVTCIKQKPWLCFRRLSVSIHLLIGKRVKLAKYEKLGNWSCLTWNRAKINDYNKEI